MLMTVFVSVAIRAFHVIRCTSATSAYSTIVKTYTQVRMHLFNDYSELSSTRRESVVMRQLIHVRCLWNPPTPFALILDPSHKDRNRL